MTTLMHIAAASGPVHPFRHASEHFARVLRLGWAQVAGCRRGLAAVRVLLGASAGFFAAGLPATVLAAALSCGGLLALTVRSGRCVPSEPPEPALDRRLEPPSDPDLVLVDAAEAVGRRLELAYVAIELDARRYQWGDCTGESAAVPLVYGDRRLGCLRASARCGGLTGRERRELEAQAVSVALIVHSVGLSKQAIRSQEEIVAAREEERRSLRRDLHDRLGSSLAALTMTLDAARNLLDHDPPAVEALLTGMREQSQSAIADIRQLAFGLRPPTLDQLGFVAAVRDCVEHHASRSDLQIRVETPDRAGALPAAVEVAALRIVLEAMSNVERHAHARHCSVRLDVGEAVEVEVVDDGAGLPPGWQPGNGVHAMRALAREVGGACTIEASARGGVRVRARLPLAIA